MSTSSRDGPNGCWSNDPRPEKPDRYSGPRSAAKDGYTVSARRPRSSKPGDIVRNEQADRVDTFHEQMEGMEGTMPFYSDYDD